MVATASSSTRFHDNAMQAMDAPAGSVMMGRIAMLEKRSLILCVDDEPSVCEMVKEFLEESGGYEVVTASDPTQALDLIASESPDLDLVLLDIRMPSMTGLEVLRAVKKYNEDIVVIMVTAVRDIETALDAMRSGAYDYIVKPLGMDELLFAVERALDRRRLILENRDYRTNLEEKVAEQTEHLAQRIRELTALNTLFQSHLNQRYELEMDYHHLASGIKKAAEAAQELADKAAARRVHARGARAKNEANPNTPTQTVSADETAKRHPDAWLEGTIDSVPLGV